MAIATLFQWASIYIAHLRFRQGLRAQGKDLSTLPFKGLLTPWVQYFGLLIVLFVFGCEFYLACWPFGEKGSVKSFFSSYLAAPLFFFDYFVYKVRLLVHDKMVHTSNYRSGITKPKLSTRLTWILALREPSMSRIL